MISRPIFHIFLALTVFFIVIGIALVIFTQFDRGYTVIENESGITTKQNKLVKQISQAATRMSLSDAQIQNKAQTDSNVLTLIEQVKQDDTDSDNTDDEQSQTATDQELARIHHLNQQDYRLLKPSIAKPYSSAYDDYQRDWLRNNPWSPDYNPNRHY